MNLLDEQMESLKLGFLDRLDTELHRDGTFSADAVMGLDALYLPIILSASSGA